MHVCINCEYPIAIYGRIWPCLHAFCLSCASEMAKCSLCALLSCFCLCQGSGINLLLQTFCVKAVPSILKRPGAALLKVVRSL